MSWPLLAPYAAAFSAGVKVGSIICTANVVPFTRTVGLSLVWMPVPVEA